MEVEPLCASCILATHALLLQRHFPDRVERINLFREVLRAVDVYLGPHINIDVLATMAYRRLKSLVGERVVPPDERRRMYEEARRAARTVEDLVESASSVEEKLRVAATAAALASRAACFGVLAEMRPPSSAEVLGANLVRDDVAEAASLARNGTVVYITSTLLELPYDEILISVLREELGAEVVAVVRSGEAMYYVDNLDLSFTRLAEVASDVVASGSDEVIPGEEASPLLAERLSEAQLVVAKGMPQLAYFTSRRWRAPVLLLAHICCPMAGVKLGLPRGAVVAQLLRAGEGS